MTHKDVEYSISKREPAHTPVKEVARELAKVVANISQNELLIKSTLNTSVNKKALSTIQ